MGKITNTLLASLSCAIVGGVTVGVGLLYNKDLLGFARKDRDPIEIGYGALLGLGAGMILSVAVLVMSQCAGKSENELVSLNSESEADGDEQARLYMQGMVDVLSSRYSEISVSGRERSKLMSDVSEFQPAFYGAVVNSSAYHKGDVRISPARMGK